MAASDMEIRLVPEGAIDSSAPVEDVKRDSRGAQIDVQPMSAEIMEAKNKKKMYRLALNRIRSIMITLVVFFHCSSFYDPSSPLAAYYGLGRYYVVYLDVILGSSGWPMLVFFTLAGYAAYHSLRVRPVKDFVEDRSLRLVPPIFFGIGVLQPVAFYCLYLSYVGYQDFGYFYYHFFFDCLGLNVESCAEPTQMIGIFWYLLYLYVYCIAGLPVFLLWKRAPSPKITGRIGTAAVICMLFALPFVLFATDIAWMASLDDPFLQLFSKSNFYEYFVLILFGFFLAWCSDAHEILLNCTWFFCGFSISLIPLIFCFDMSGNFYDLDWNKMLLLDVFAGAMFCSVWGLAHKYLPLLPKAAGKVADYIAERAIAIYVLHYVIQSAIWLALVYATRNSLIEYNTTSRLILHFLLSYSLTLGAYEAFFRYKYTKILVGMLRVADLPKRTRPLPASSKQSEQTRNGVCEQQV